jgi:hypothetical protein
MIGSLCAWQQPATSLTTPCSLQNTPPWWHSLLWLHSASCPPFACLCLPLCNYTLLPDNFCLLCLLSHFGLRIKHKASCLLSNSCTTWTMTPVLLVLVCLTDGVWDNFLPGLASNHDPHTPPSWVPGNTGMYHHAQLQICFLNTTCSLSPLSSVTTLCCMTTPISHLCLFLNCTLLHLCTHCTAFHHW